MADEIPPESEWPAGFVPKAHMNRVVQERINDVAGKHKAALDALKAQLGSVQSEADARAARIAELEPVAKEFTTYKMGVEREAAYRGVGLTIDGLDETAKATRERERGTLEALYAAQPDEGRPGFGEWLAGLKDDPVLSRLLPSPVAPTTEGTPGGSAPPAPASPPRPVATPSVQVGAQQPPKPVQRTVATIKAEIAAIQAEALRLPPGDARNAKLAEARALISSGGAATS